MIVTLGRINCQPSLFSTIAIAIMLGVGSGRSRNSNLGLIVLWAGYSRLKWRTEVFPVLQLLTPAVPWGFVQYKGWLCRQTVRSYSEIDLRFTQFLQSATCASNLLRHDSSDVLANCKSIVATGVERKYACEIFLKELWT